MEDEREKFPDPAKEDEPLEGEASEDEASASEEPEDIGLSIEPEDVSEGESISEDDIELETGFAEPSAEGTETGRVETVPARRKESYFTTVRIAYLAIFTALSYLLYIFDFPLFPGTPAYFLRLDFSNVFVMITGFALGPVSGVICGVLKELIHALTFGNTFFVGELANTIMLLPYVLIPAIMYKRRKGLRWVILGLVLGSLGQIIISMPVNYLLNFPAFCLAYMGSWSEGYDLFVEVWYWVLLFNVIKTVAISAVALLIYKPISGLVKRTNARFQKRRA